MTTKIFCLVTRGMTDKTAVCVFPWEKAILERIHGGNVEEVSIDQMCDLKAPLKVEKNRTKIKRQDADGKEVDPETPPSLREQLEAMAKVHPDDDPKLDPAAEYGRLIDRYGMDAEIEMPVVAVIYGQIQSRGLENAIKEAQSAAPAPARKPASIKGAKQAPQYEGRLISEMTIGEVRKALKAEGVDYDQHAKLPALRDQLAMAAA